MTDLQTVFEILDSMSDAERQQVIEYLQLPAPRKTSQPRVIGLHASLGEAWMSDDFNDELPVAFWQGSDPPCG